MEFKNKEIKLAAELKKICVKTQDGKWKETNPKSSAKILHKLGLLYMEKSPDKLSLVRSCALLNAAITRNPSNVQTITNDLDNLCLHLLKTSKADQLTANLRNISKTVASKVETLRKNTKDQLSNIKHIPCDASESKIEQLECNKIKIVSKLQQDISNQYTNVMQYIAEKCVKIMGIPPCRFAIAGMGSLARREITPYSDFEHIILLNDNSKIDSKILEYFRWLSIVFHYIILNLQETILPCVAIPSLNDYYTEGGIDWFFDGFTKRGISFDGMMPSACAFPLGRQDATTNKPWSTELIRPVSEMIKYLDSDIDLKNGYHLADVLKRTCFVYGSEEIHKHYRSLVNQNLENNKSYEIEVVLEKLDKCCSVTYIKSFNIDTTQFNIKQVVYRTVSFMLSAFCDLHRIFSTGFEAIKELEKLKIINSKTSHHLKYALSIACEIRLRMYTKKNRQDENIDKGRTITGVGDFNPAEDLIQAVGITSLVRFFEIVQFTRYFELEEYLRVNIPDQQTSSLTYWWSLHILRQYRKIIQEWEKRSNLNWLENDDKGIEINLHVSNAYIAPKNYYAALKILKKIKQFVKPGTQSYVRCIIQTIECLTNLEEYKEVESVCQAHLNQNPFSNFDVSFFIQIIRKCGYAQIHMKKTKDALLTYLKYGRINEKFLVQLPGEVLNIYRGIGECYQTLGNFKLAEINLKKALDLLDNLTIKPIISQVSINTLLITCYSEMGKLNEAKEHQTLLQKTLMQCNESEVHEVLQLISNKFKYF